MQELIVIGASTPTIIRVIEDINKCIKHSGFRLIGFVDSDTTKHGNIFYGVPVLGGFDSCLSYDRKKVKLINTIAGSIQSRVETTKWFLDRGVGFTNVIHPSVNLQHCELGVGNLIYENATIHPYVKIGNHCIISSNSGLSHETTVGDYCFLGPASYIGGKVIVENRVFIGLGAHVLPRVTLAAGAVIAAGALVTKSIEAEKRVRGIPAKEF